MIPALAHWDVTSNTLELPISFISETDLTSMTLAGQAGRLVMQEGKKFHEAFMKKDTDFLTR